jgi:hypothetical protein
MAKLKIKLKAGIDKVNIRIQPLNKKVVDVISNNASSSIDNEYETVLVLKKKGA